MSDCDKNWCDTNYIRPVSKYQFVLRNKNFFSHELQQSLLKNNIYLASYTYDDPIHGNMIFDCLADFVSEHVLEQLRSREALLIFDQSFEGDWQDFPIDQSVYNSIYKYNLPAGSICVLTGTTTPPRYADLNFVYHPALKIFTLKNNMSFFLDEYDRPRDLPHRHHGYYFSAMTCKHRYWRSWGLYHLLHSEHSGRALLTHLHAPGNIEPKHIADYLNQHSPIVCEFEDNPLDGPSVILHAAVNSDLHTNVLFHLAMETCQDSDTVFYTEKTYKAIIAETPTLIWGTPGMNTVHWQQMGFRTYEDWFDLSFDQEPDPQKRWALLQQEIERVCVELDSMTLDQRIAWSLQSLDVVKHNKQHMFTIIDQRGQELTANINNYFSRQHQ